MCCQPRRFTSVSSALTFGMQNWIRLGPLAVALAGCSVGPDYQTPATLLPVQYLPQAKKYAAVASPRHVMACQMTEAEGTVADGFLHLDSGSPE
jgi:hypothetical protein